MLCQAYEIYVALFTGGLKPRSTISCLSTSWRRAAHDLQSRWRGNAAERTPRFSRSEKKRERRFPRHLHPDGLKRCQVFGVSWLSLSFSTRLHIIFLMSRSFVCPMVAQLNLGFSLTPEFVWTQEVIILFIWPFTGINMVKIYGKGSRNGTFCCKNVSLRSVSWVLRKSRKDWEMAPW